MEKETKYSIKGDEHFLNRGAVLEILICARDHTLAFGSINNTKKVPIMEKVRISFDLI
jgi:hypothetical protein